jgi:large subunit ribosomal protein L25
MDKVILKANTRTDFSKSGRNVLRRNGRVPGIYYSRHGDPVAVEVAENMIKPLVFTAQTHLIGLELTNGDVLDCVIKDVQFDPVTDKIVHFDLLGLTKGEKIQLEVPVQLLGNAVGIKEGGQIQHSLHKLQIECLPTDIPQYIELEITNLHLGDALHVSDVNMENITILHADDAVIVAITHPKVEKEVLETEGAAAEPEVITKGKTEKED